MADRIASRSPRLSASFGAVTISALLFTASGPLTAGHSRAIPVERTWTLQDIVSAPQVTDLLISDDGSYATYIIRAGDIAKNERRSSLRRVDLASGTERELSSSSRISDLHSVPGTTDVSVLAEMGHGVQLYRIGRDGELKPVLINSDLDQVGGPMEGLHPVGVSDYGWSPDGKSFWYEKRTSTPADPRVVNPRMLPMFVNYGRNPVELRVRNAAGHDVFLDRVDAMVGGFYAVEWLEGSSLSYWARAKADQTMERRRWSPGMAKSDVVSSQSAFYVPAVGARGLGGGVLSTKGFGKDRTLVETAPDGTVVEHGRVGFRIGHPGASSAWTAPEGDVALFGVRFYKNPRYGLIRLTKGGGLEEVPVEGSLTNCSINPAFTAGACVRQSMTTPPQLVSLNPRTGGATLVRSLTSRHSAITPLRTESRTWVNRDGYVSSGSIVYPRNYNPNRRYPAILVTHGGDADQRFVAADFQWDFPVQVWAERGYVVIAMNDPAGSDDASLTEAYAQWGGSGVLPLERVQDLIWINIAHSYEDAVKELASEGLVDIGRVGIAGYSFGSQTVNVTMTQTKLFRAASSGDGGYLEPSGYFINTDSYKAIYGSSPYEPSAIALYQRLSPTFRASLAAGPVLQQVATGNSGQLEFNVALRAAGIPSEIVHYPGESHLFHRPSNRLSAMQENLDWFDFWLLGQEDPEPAKAAQYSRWRAMREAWKRP